MKATKNELLVPNFSPRDTCITAAYDVVRYLSVTFVHCVETAKDTAIVAMECVNEKV